MAQVLRPVQGHAAATHPNLILGVGLADDAGVFALGDGRALIQTIDIFTPVVDDPYDWGRVAAANALSDVYAMGAKPLTALNYLAWPRDELPFDLASAVLEGGMDVMSEAGCTVVGGHSVDAPEPSFGYAVTGVGDTRSVVDVAGARPGDQLVVTKPLGIGIATTAIKKGLCPPEVAAAAVEVMTKLNSAAGDALAATSARAATDVTGFGLLGHLDEICRASGVGATVTSSSVPVIAGVRELLEVGAWAGGSQRNLENSEGRVVGSVPPQELKLLVDAQTSGGLLVALSPENVGKYQDLVPGATLIGEFNDSLAITVE